MHQRAGTLHVRTLHAELIYALAPGTSISEAFRVFGAGKGDTKVCVYIVCCCRAWGGWSGIDPCHY